MQFSASSVASLSPASRQKWLDSLTDEEIYALTYDWRFWARPEQLPPEGDWQYWLYLAGRGSGKTRAGAEWVRDLIENRGYMRGALVAPTRADARQVMVEGESGILAVCPPDNMPDFQPSNRQLVWPNGAQVTLFSAEEPNRLRGPQHEFAWCDELATWQYLQDTWDMLQFGLRLGDKPQAFISTTPKPSKVIRWLIDQARTGMTALTTGSTYANAANLAPAFLNAIIKRYEGTRLGRQELLAELLEDNPDALWQLSQIDALRVKTAPPLARTVIAVDPPTTSGEDADECGIIAVGTGQHDKHGYVLADRSVHRMRPNEWMARVVQAYHDFDADIVVAEINQGGEMVEDLLRGVDANIRYKGVHAKRGKFLRAEPVSALYEQSRVHHVGTLSKLEDQMTDFTPDFDPDQMGYSPDRLDALVYGVSELMLRSGRSEPRIRGL